MTEYEIDDNVFDIFNDEEELDDSWIKEIENEEKLYSTFYTEENEIIKLMYIYINRENEIYHIKKDNAIRLKPIFNKIKYKQIDFTDLKSVKKELKNSDVIMHFFGRANTSVGSNTNLDLNHGIISTYNVLESMI